MGSVTVGRLWMKEGDRGLVTHALGGTEHMEACSPGLLDDPVSLCGPSNRPPGLQCHSGMWGDSVASLRVISRITTA